ncbi:FAD-binding oxidoreductase [Cytobacillus purgationiresistens]|uniref:D-lactate dehydrogenase (cytochrome) n=1 Tax=Cytobacillus purgationiresistens TaxID=863449 RepID=A0ABU0ATW5_9BACI|nr:FAD-linked oxidase C-terminal domain-containing protein [Cytobacillus purgationiresistens]MDQ0273470.1 glycolate oxidase subunit GlcD [Cytobacillus purgationiresistens]
MYKQLIQLLGEDKVSKSETQLFHHSKDESYHPAVEPDVVVFPSCKEDVVAIVQFANQQTIPIIPFGAGSGLEGQAIPVKKGISISFQNMNQIVSFQPDDMLVTVQPGVTRLQLNEAVNRKGLFFPVDPGADATIGGMAATNASGTAAVRYGTMRDQVLQLEVVLPNGKIIQAGSLAKKSSSGYHLNGLFIGSEGTLGVFTEITLKLQGIPEAVLAARCSFSNIEASVKAAQAVLHAGIPVGRMELVDDVSIRKVNEYSGTSYPEQPSLFFEFHGNESGIKEDAALAEMIAREAGSIDWLAETDSKARATLWKARHELAYAFRHQNPKLKAGGTDVCVPISKLGEVVSYARNIIDQYGIEGGVLGHIGDGNFHTIYMYDPDNPDEIRTMNEIDGHIVKLALSYGGTCTGEHGVGLGKIKYQQAEHGASLELMQDIKQLIDPKQIMNPGKVLPRVTHNTL